MALVCLKTDYEDNKMKKDTLATLHDYTNNYILINLHKVISNVLSDLQIQWFFAVLYEHCVNCRKNKTSGFKHNQYLLAIADNAHRNFIPFVESRRIVAYR